MFGVSRKMVIRTLAALIAGATAFYIASLIWYGRGTSDVREDRSVPAFALKDYEGNEVRESDLRGKPAVIMVWASWCPFCAEQIAHLDAVKREFGDAIMIVAINRAESLAHAMQGNALPEKAAGTIFLLDPDDAYYRAIGGFAMPEMLFIDRDGRVVLHKRSPQSREALRRRIEDLLAR